jgi:hypothetical protein
VKEPVAVRYAGGTFPSGTLVTAGSTGLPVAPFRTDREVWPDVGFGNSNGQRAYVKTQRNRAEGPDTERQGDGGEAGSGAEVELESCEFID